MAKNEEPNTKGDGGMIDDSNGCEAMETVRNEVMHSGCGEILIAETRRNRMKMEEERKEVEIKVKRLEKEMVELSKSSFYQKQEKEKNGKIISHLTKRVEEGVEKDGLFMEIEALVDDLVREEKNIEMLTQQRVSLDVNLNQIQQEAVNLRYTIETLTRDKAELEEAKMLAINVTVDLRRELSKLNEAMMSESSVAKNGRNEESVSQMGCSREAPNEVSSEKDKLSLPLEGKEWKLKKPRLKSRKRKPRRWNHWIEHLSLWGSFVRNKLK